MALGGPFIAGSVRRYTTQHDKPTRPGLVHIQSVPFEKDSRNLNLWSNLQSELRRPKRDKETGADRLLRNLKRPIHQMPQGSELAMGDATSLAPAPREEIEERLRRMLEAATIESCESNVAADDRDDMNQSSDDAAGPGASFGLAGSTRANGDSTMKSFRHARPLSAGARVSAAAKARVPIIRPCTASVKRSSDERGTPGYMRMLAAETRGAAPVAGLPLQHGRPHTATERTRELVAVGGAETALARTWARVGEWDTTIVPRSRPVGHAQRYARPESAPSHIARRRS